jgi:thiol-disulfide isomerase/thioredoxin
MTSSPSHSTLNFYRRDGCEPCDEARLTLQAVMEERAKRGDPNPRVRYIDVSADSDLEARFGARVPVLTLGEDELALTLSARAIAQLLDRNLGRAA